MVRWLTVTITVTQGVDTLNDLDSLPLDNPSESASSVAEALTRNKASAKAVQGGDTPSSDGKPTVKRAAVKRSQPRGKGGKFARKNTAEPVEKPQNTEKPQPQPQADNGGGDGFVRVPMDQTAEQPSGVAMGPEAGRVITDGVFNFATKRGGDKWKPSDSEREMISKAAAGATDGRRVPWWLALVLAVGFYAAARVGLDKVKKEKQGTVKNGVDKHGDNRADAIGKNTLRKADGWTFEKSF